MQRAAHNRSWELCLLQLSVKHAVLCGYLRCCVLPTRVMRRREAAARARTVLRRLPLLPLLCAPPGHATHLSRICMCSSCARNAPLCSSDMPATASGEKFIVAAWGLLLVWEKEGGCFAAKARAYVLLHSIQLRLSL